MKKTVFIRLRRKPLPSDTGGMRRDDSFCAAADSASNTARVSQDTAGVRWWSLIFLCLVLAGCSGISSVSKKISEKKGNSVVEINYPEIKGLPQDQQTEVNTAISQILDSVRSDFERNAILADRNTNGTGPNSLSVEYKTSLLTEKFISIGFEIKTSLKGAKNANYFRLPFNHDVVLGETLKTPDIFSGSVLKVLSSFSEKQFISEMKSKGPVSGNDEEWIKTGTAPSFDNFRSMTLEKNYLVIWFAPFQVGPGGAAAEVRIPMSEISNFLTARVRSRL